MSGFSFRLKLRGQWVRVTDCKVLWPPPMQAQSFTLRHDTSREPLEWTLTVDEKRELDRVSRLAYEYELCKNGEVA